MRLHLEDDEQITLTINEISILVALVEFPLDGRGIARACAQMAGLAYPMSNGALYPALKRLERFSLIVWRAGTSPSPGRPRKVYALTPTGELILEWHISTLSRVTTHAQRHLARRARTARAIAGAPSK